MARRKKEAETAAERSELEDLKLDAKRTINRIDDRLEELERLSPEDVEELGTVAAGEADLGGMAAKVLRMPAQKPGRSKQDYATPMELIRAVEKRFGVLVHDLAAHAQNTRCKTFYSKEQDSLKQSWHRDFPKGNLWLNPEFGNIPPFVAKCFEESREREGLIITLTPASIGSEWFAEHVENKALVIGLRPRLSFDGINPYPKDTMIMLYGRDVTPGFETWRWDGKKK